MSIEPKSIAAGWYHTVGLKSDGTTIGVGTNAYGQLNTTDWTDIIQVVAGTYHTVGLKSDGTVIAIGLNTSNQCNVTTWTNITQICADRYNSFGIKSDGTAIAVGYNGYNQCNITGWTDIVQIASGYNHTVGLKLDGTVVGVGYNNINQYSTTWTDIIQLSALFTHTVGLKSDGTAVATGYNTSGQCNVSSWTDLIQVSAGYRHTVGLKSDGTVVAVGLNNYGQCNITTWTDIIKIICGDYHTVGLKSDGTVVAIGLNTQDQCNVSSWTDILLPSLDPVVTGVDFNFTEINYTPPAYNNITFWFAPAQEIILATNTISTSFNISYSIETSISNVLNTEIGFYPISDRVISFLPDGVNLINTGIGLEIESDSFNAYAIQNNINTGLSLGFGYDKVINISPNLINTGMSISYAKDIDMIFPVNSVTSSFGFIPQITTSIQNTLTVSQNLSIGNKITSKFQYINYIGNVKSSHEYINNINNLLKSEYEYILSFLTNTKNEFINSILISTRNEFTNDINALVKSDFEFNNTLLNVVNSSNEFINTFYIKSGNEYINDISTVVKNKFEFNNNLLNSISSKNEYINSFYVKLKNEYINDINSIVSSKFEFANNLLNIVNSKNEYLNTFYLKSNNEFVNDIRTLIKSKVEYSNLLSTYAKSSNEFINTMLVSSNYEYSNGIDIIIKSINEFANNLTLMVNSKQEYINDVLSYVPAKSTYKYINNLQDETAIINTNIVTCYVNGQEIEVYSFDLSIDDDSYCYSFSAELNTLEDWFLCVPDSQLIFTVNSVAYHLKIDSRNRTREFGDEKLQIEARSKTSVLGEGNDNTITKTWDGMFVRDIISEVCSDNGIDFTYSMPNWFIQEGLLTSDTETPISLMQRLIEACGGLIVCNNLGVLNFISKYPMCPTLYDTYVSKISDYDNIFSISETKEINNKWNSVIVSNIEDATDYSYSISEINDMEDDPYTKHIRVKVYPYLQSIDLLTSYISNDIVIVSYDNPIEELIEDEYIEIVEGQGSSSELIKNIISYEYLNQNLGTIQFDGNDLTTQILGQSLLKINYKTEYHDFLVHSFGIERIQVYTTDENEVL